MKTHDNKGILSTGIPINTNDKAKSSDKSTPDNPPEVAAALRLNRVVDMSSIARHPKANKSTPPKQNNPKTSKKTPSSDSNAKQTHHINDKDATAQTRNRFNKSPSQPNNHRILSQQNAAQSNNTPQNAASPQYSTQRRIVANLPTSNATTGDKDKPTKLLHSTKPQTHAIYDKPEKQFVAPPAPKPAEPTRIYEEIAPKPAQVDPNPEPQEAKTAIKKHAVRVALKPVAKKDRTVVHATKIHKHVVKHNDVVATTARALATAHADSLKIEQSLMLQSWHACLWCDAITDMSQAVVDSLPNSIPLVSAGLVNNICVTPGCLEATIFDQVVSIELRQFAQGQWRNVIAMLSDRAIFTTSLLNGELPQGIVDIFKQASLSLFPTKLREFTFHCNCRTLVAPCEHACALLIAFAQKLEEDPFNMLTLRGMTRENLLSMIRSARSDQIVDEKTKYRISYELPAQSVSFADFYSPRDSRDGHENIDDINFHISYSPATILRRLGNPAIWHAPMSVESILQPIIEAAAREAEMLGQCEHYEIPVPDTQKVVGKPLKVQVVQNPPTSRAPRNSANSRDKIPDMGFVEDAIDPAILADLSDDPIHAAKDIYRWLLTRGASDIRTLARRTRLNKTTIEAFLNAFRAKGIVVQEVIGDRVKFSLNL